MNSNALIQFDTWHEGWQALRNYKNAAPLEKIKEGGKNVLWPGKPKYFAKTSGTTSGAKLIPITKESMPNHIKSARNALLFYINKTCVI